MRIPINWLSQFSSLPKDKSKLTDGLTMLGHMLDKEFHEDGQTIIDLELRGNRADCYSLMGIAREVSALFNTEFISPKVVQLKSVKSLGGLQLKTDTPLVKRVGIVKIKNVTIEKSPKWLSGNLHAYGIESVNNIVDLTNYVMVETGEPMHAFDYDKVGDNLEIRLAKNGEKITTFLNTSVTLTKEDLVWAKEGQILSVAGAIGEKTNSISETTKNVLLEAANYDRTNIRRSVHRLNLLTEAGLRHEKDLDPNLVEPALARFLYLLKKNNWGIFEPAFLDYYPKPVSPWVVSLDLNHLSNIAGFEIPKPQAVGILKRLNFEIKKDSQNILEVLVPTYRTDILIEEDLIEEILRVSGYENIPIKTLSLEIPEDITPDYIKQEHLFREAAESVGLNEVISLPFVKEKYKEMNLNPESSEAKTVTLVNPPSPDTQSLRQWLFPNLLDGCQKIIDGQGTEVALFEIGKIYFKKRTFQESRKIGLIYWKNGETTFSEFKGIVEALINKSGLNPPTYKNEPKRTLLKNSYNIFLKGKPIGFGGQKENIFYAELDLDSILGKSEVHAAILWPKYPPQIEDLTLSLPEKTKIGDIMDTIKEASEIIQKVELKDIFESNFTFRIWYQSDDKTLNNSEVESIRNLLIKKLKTKFNVIVK